MTMRKFTLFFIVIAFVSNVMAQKAYLPEAKQECELSSVKHYSKTEFNTLKSTTLWGDVIWSEDFSGGQIPASWVVVDNNGLNYVWYWSDDARPGHTGTYSTNNDTFYATTADNGYIMISGDIYNAGGSAVLMDSYFMTAPINCDTCSSVMLMFEQYFRNCCSSATTALVASVSTDNVTWTDFDVLNGVAINAPSDNPDVVAINITQIAAGQSTVYLKFHKSGASHYFWAIDDIKLVTAPQNEIKFSTTYNTFIGYVGTSYDYTGYYSRIPDNQIAPLYLAADIINAGDQVQTDVTLTCRVVDGSGNEVFNQNADTSQLVFDSIAYIEMPVNFIPAGVDDYTISFECSQNEVDEIPENNVADEVNFSVVSNHIYAHDLFRTGTVTPDNYVDGADGDFIGVDFYIANQDTIKSLSVYVDYRSAVNTVLIGQVYRQDAENVLIIESEEYYITESDLGTWVELPLVTVNIGDDILTTETFYTMGVEVYWGADDLLIGSDDSDFHLFNRESALRIGSTWYWISEVPQVRVNFKSAITPPDFISIPELECPLNQSYDYVAVVADQGLANTFEVTTNYEIGISGATSGNTCTLSSSTPESMGFAVGGKFRVRIIADNGFAKNEQYYYVTVTDPIGINENATEEVNIYPNPAQNILNITNSLNSDIIIYNLLGEVVSSVKAVDSFTTMNLSQLAPGSYIITIIKGDNVYSKQFNHIR